MTWKTVNTPKGDNKLYSDAKGVVPSLDLRFAEGKTLNDYMTGTPLVDHQRSMSGSNLSAGTFVNSSGLIETAKVNLLPYSEDFSSWNTASIGDGIAPTTTIVNSKAPDGSLQVTEVTLERATATTSNYSIFRKQEAVPAVITTASIYVKASTDSDVGKVIDFYNNQGSAIPTTVVTLTNEWQRVSNSGTSALTTAFPSLALYTASASTGVVKVLIWGAQLEEGTTPTTYIPTTNLPSAAPRFDHDPTTGESLGLLVEEARTNLVTRSEEFDNSYWVKGTGSTVDPDTETAPDGNLTADTYTTTGANQNLYTSAITVLSSTDYTFSLYVKLGTMTAADYKIAIYDLTNATFIASDVVPSQVPTSNGWTRVTYTFTTPGTCTSARVYAFRNSGVISSSTVYFWGAQIEEGAFPTSYIPTSGAQVTRAVDVASIAGSNFSSWYNQSEGTVFSKSFNRQLYDGTNKFPYILQFDDGTNDNIIGFDHSVLSGGYRAQYSVIDSTVNQVSLAVESGIATGDLSLCAAYKLNSFAASSNGNTTNTDTSGTVPTVNRLQIGEGLGQQYNGTISRITYFPERLPDSTLQTITTP